MMFFLSWIVALVMPILFLPMGFEGLIMGSIAGLFVGFLIFVIGIIVLVYGLVAKSDLERAALMRPPVVVSTSMMAEAQSSIRCQNCVGENQPHARFCISCGNALS